MNSRKILYSSGNNDECLTPAFGVKPILKYIPKNAVVWCPFDTEQSEFVKQISKQNKVVLVILRMVKISLIMNPNFGMFL